MEPQLFGRPLFVEPETADPASRCVGLATWWPIAEPALAAIVFRPTLTPDESAALVNLSGFGSLCHRDPATGREFSPQLGTKFELPRSHWRSWMTVPPGRRCLPRARQNRQERQQLGGRCSSWGAWA